MAAGAAGAGVGAAAYLALAAAVIGAGATVYAANKNKPPGMPQAPTRDDPVKPDTEALDRQKQRRAQAGGRDDTIRTSPLGITTDSTAPRKTLLGQ